MTSNFYVLHHLTFSAFLWLARQLTNVKELDFVKYKTASDIETDENELSTDQKYLLL